MGVLCLVLATVTTKVTLMAPQKAKVNANATVDGIDILVMVWVSVSH